MTWSELTRLIFDHAGGALWTITRTALIWVFLAIVSSLIAYRVARRRGALEVPDGRRWPRLTLALGLAFVTVPACGMMGVVTGMRDTATKVIDDQLADDATAEAVGNVLLAPVLAAGPPGDDLRWLGSAETRTAALDQITTDGIAMTAELVDPDDHAITRWLRDRAERALRGLVRDHRARYDALFARVVPEADGQLERASAARQVGRTFARREVHPPIRKTFDDARTALAAVALLPAVAVLLAAWLLRRRHRQRETVQPTS